MQKLIVFLLFIMFATASTFEYHNHIGETIGTVIGVSNDFIHIEGEALNSLGMDNVIINVSNAPVFDLITGYPISVCEIAAGMNIRVVYDVSPATEPTALVIWLNCDYDNSAVFTVVVSENIHYGYENCTFLSADGKYRVTVSSKTVIIDPYLGEISPGDITPGQEFFVWVDTITASSPSLVYPDKVVLIYD